MGMGKSVRHTPFANNPPSKPKTEAQHFLAILSQAQIPAQTRVIILVLSPFRFDTNMFLSEVKEEIARVSYPAFTENAILLDTESLLNKEDHFVLDEHLRASGHRKIAESISEIINSPDL